MNPCCHIPPLSFTAKETLTKSCFCSQIFNFTSSADKWTFKDAGWEPTSQIAEQGLLARWICAAGPFECDDKAAAGATAM